MSPSIGRTVHFVVDSMTAQLLGGNHASGFTRIAPATVVALWPNDCVNLKVFGDGPNDVWVTSVMYSEDVNVTRSWHWPERT